MRLIYVADDDLNIRELLLSHLESSGYEVMAFENGLDLYEKFLEKPSDMIITDIMMPKMGGYDLCRAIRKTSMVPFFMISANNDEIDRVLGIELGSDDYISKPISFRELLAKVRNVFLRIELNEKSDAKNNPHCISHMDLKINIESREVFVNNEKLEATTKEFELLCLFLQNKNQAFSRDQIIEKIWGYDYFGDSRQVDHVIKRLRKKMIEKEAVCKITTIWGYGYKIGDNND